MKYLYLLFIGFTSMMSFASDIDFDLNGETRFRTQYSLDTDEINTDIRSRLSLKIGEEHGFYQKTDLELGNIDLNSDLIINDFYEIETKELYLGYKTDLIKGKIGIIDVDTQGSIYSGEDLGLQVKVKSENIDFKGFYTLQNIVSDTWEVLEDFSELNHLAYLSAEYIGIPDNNISLWMSYFEDNDEKDYFYYSLWIGSEFKKEYKKFHGKVGFTYNLGEVTSHRIPISSWLLNTELKLSIDNSFEFVTRFNLIGNSDDTRVINQYQTVDGDGEINSELSLLTEVVLNMDNLSTNDLVYDNSSLFFYEIGYKKQFKDIPLESVIVLGGVSEGEFVIGIEMDLNNKLEILKNLDLNINTAYLLQAGDDNFNINCYLEYFF